MKKITPHLWFDTQAVEATNFYITLFDDSKIESVRKIKDTPSGDCDYVTFTLAGQPFEAISAGPYFKLNPSISFFLNFDPSVYADAEDRLTKTWEKLLDGGKVLMELNEYPFSKKYGWIQDKFGVTWQLMLTNPEGEPRPFIVPSLMFANAVAGRGEEAMDFYTSVFKDGKRGTTALYPEDDQFNKKGMLMFGDFYIGETWIAAMDSGMAHEFVFNEAISFIVKCDNQEEIDYFWEKLSADPESEQCGWLKDKFGVSWQITPAAMDEMMNKGGEEQIQRVTQAFLKMKKFDIAELQKAYDGN